MIYLKTEEEVEKMRRSAQVLGKVHAEVARLIEPGVSTIELDERAEAYIRDHHGLPSFKGYNGFPFSLCISVNEVVVHGFPGPYRLQEGDLVSIDCGVKLDGYHADSAYTYAVGEVSPEVKALMQRTYDSLYRAIDKASAGNRIGDLSQAVQQYVEEAGYGVVRELVGHGIGRSLHEEPQVPNYGRRGSGMLLKEGMTLAIEPMITLGKRAVVQERDGWTIRTADRLPAAHYEHTVVVRKGTPEIITTFAYIEQVLNDRRAVLS